MSETKQALRLYIRRFEEGAILYVEGTDVSLPIEDWAVAQKIMEVVNAHDRLESNSKKLLEPAVCNAGHKSNLPLALWDCPVCTQLLRDQLQQLKNKARELAEIALELDKHRTDKLYEMAAISLDRMVIVAREVEAALKGSPADTNSHAVRKARGAMVPDVDLEAHERDLERRAGCEDE